MGIHELMTGGEPLTEWMDRPNFGLIRTLRLADPLLWPNFGTNESLGLTLPMTSQPSGRAGHRAKTFAGAGALNRCRTPWTRYTSGRHRCGHRADLN
jgi:hypothetical protein